MTQIVVVLLSLLCPDGLEKTAPTYLTQSSAREHVAAATVAAIAYRVPRELLLSIAWHESRYTDARTPEAGGRVSCGVMTPEPLRACHDTIMLDGYLAGAAHLRTWLDATRSTRDALLGYAGGYHLIQRCELPDTPRQCQTPEVFLGRARWIAHVLSKG